MVKVKNGDVQAACSQSGPDLASRGYGWRSGCPPHSDLLEVGDHDAHRFLKDWCDRQSGRALPS
jgi:hypothetical protein